jgi:hypothetical protein
MRPHHRFSNNGIAIVVALLAIVTLLAVLSAQLDARPGSRPAGEAMLDSD